MNITVEETGERLYITPFAYKFEDRRITFYDSSEFPPHPNHRRAEEEISKWWYLKHYKTGTIRRFIRLKWLNVEKAINALHYLRDRNIRWFGHYFKWGYWLAYPFVGLVQNDLRLSVAGQLVVIDPDELTETYYLEPSQKYLQQRYETEASRILNCDKVIIGDTDDIPWESREEWVFDHERNDARRYFAWKHDMECAGYAIEYIAELDT